MQIPVYLRFAVPFLSTPSARRATRRHPIVSNTNQNFYPRPPRGGRRHQMHNGTKTKKISIHALREEGDPHRRNHSLVLRLFLSTPSARRATLRMAIALQHIFISIHALREEGDHILPVFPQQTARFLSTPSARRATVCIVPCVQRRLISIHALREEGDLFGLPVPCCSANFYPRPPRGGRPVRTCHAPCARQISIHALREEGDHISSLYRAVYSGFLSTPSARRATPVLPE